VSGHVLVCKEHLINIESVRGIKWLTLTLSTIFQLYHGGQLYLCSNNMTKTSHCRTNFKIIAWLYVSVGILLTMEGTCMAERRFGLTKDRQFLLKGL
jgi:hypothetical protein